MDDLFEKNGMLFWTLFLCLAFGAFLGLAGQLTPSSKFHDQPALFFVGGVTASFFLAVILFAFLEDKIEYLPFYCFLGPLYGAFGLGLVIFLSVIF